MAVVKRCRLAAVVLALLLAGCSRQPDTPRPVPPSAKQPAPAPVVPAPPAPMSRADILGAAASAASAYAAGATYPEAAKLAGRQFAVRLALGCREETPERRVVTHDAKAGVLRFAMKPETWTEDSRVVGLVAESDTEALEGFWIRWPWMTAEGCPQGPPPASGQPADASTVGLVRLFGKDSSRLRRRGERGYEATVKVEEAPPAGAYRLVISGRIADPPDHRPVRCGAEHRDRRPTCLILVEPDRVAFETEAGEVVAEWAG